MYDQVKNNKNNSQLVNATIQKQSNKGLSLKDNRETSSSEKVIQNKINKAHNKGCGCSSCSGSAQQPIQKKSTTIGENVLQLKECSECGKSKGHLSGCSRHKHNRSNKGRDDHKLGGSHDDGSGYQKKGSGGDRHEKGRRAAQKARERKK